MIALTLQGTLAAQQFSAPTATPIPATYRVVLKDGAQYVTREPYRAKGGSAVFTLPTGQLVSIPLEKIDQEATRKENLRLHRPPPATVALKRTPVRIVMVGTPAPTLLPSKTADDSFVGHLSFSGVGHRATGLFSLSSGLYVFRLHHSGESNFIVRLVSGTGRTTDHLANQIGDFDGSKAVRIERSGKYLLNIDADGEWFISVARPD